MASGEKMFSLRIVNADFYVSDPIPGLDVCHSTFRENSTKKVPVVRIYGATPGGQKACMHIHKVFPYVYVPYDGTEPREKYIKQFATSIDFAVQVALGKASSNTQHVYDISVVRGIPIYGYHEAEQYFLKISFYNPFMVTKIVDLLQNGAVMGKVFQPHEAHIPYILQMFIDHNLYGMNLLRTASVKFRTPVRLAEGGIETLGGPQSPGGMDSSAQLPSPPIRSPSCISGTATALAWNEDTVPSGSILGCEVGRQSVCELEVDVIAPDIINRQDIGVNVGANPGLAAIWEDERQRRLEANESTQIAPPQSQERDHVPYLESERRYMERIREIIQERDVLLQCQIEKLGIESSSPEEVASLEDSIHLLLASQRGLASELSQNPDVLSELLTQKDSGLSDEGATSQVIDEREPIVDRSIVQEVVESSQSLSQKLSSSADQEMIDILVGLAADNRPCSQRLHGSQGVALDQGDAQSDEECRRDDEESSDDDHQSLVMSQRVWDDVDDQGGTGDECSEELEEQDPGFSQIRASQFDLEGIADSWDGSILVPQVDGAGDQKPNRRAASERLSLRSRRFTRLAVAKPKNERPNRPEVVIINSGESTTGNETAETAGDLDRGGGTPGDGKAKSLNESGKTDVFSSLASVPPAKRLSAQGSSRLGTSGFPGTARDWGRGRDLTRRNDDIFPPKPVILTYSKKDRQAFRASQAFTKSSGDGVTVVKEEKRKSGDEFSLRLSSSSGSDVEVNQQLRSPKARQPKDRSKLKLKEKQAKLVFPVSPPKTTDKADRLVPVCRSGIDEKEEKLDKRTLRGSSLASPIEKDVETSRELQNSDTTPKERPTFRVLSDVRSLRKRRTPKFGELKELKVQLTDVHFMPDLSETLLEAKSKLSGEKQDAFKSLMEGSRRAHAQGVSSPPSAKKRGVERNKSSPAISQRLSPKKKTPSPRKHRKRRIDEEKMKRYPALPVLFRKSPLKRPVSAGTTRDASADGISHVKSRSRAGGIENGGSPQDCAVFSASSTEKTAPVAYGVTEIFYSLCPLRGRDLEAPSTGASTSKNSKNSKKSRAAATRVSERNSVKRKLYCDAEPGIRISDGRPTPQKKSRLSLRLRSSGGVGARGSCTSDGRCLAAQGASGGEGSEEEELEVTFSNTRSSDEKEKGQNDKESQNYNNRAEEDRSHVIHESSHVIACDDVTIEDDVIAEPKCDVTARYDVSMHSDVLPRHDVDNDVIACDGMVTCIPSSPVSFHENDGSGVRKVGEHVDAGSDRELKKSPSENSDLVNAVGSPPAGDLSPELFANALFNMSRMSPARTVGSEASSPPQALSPNERTIGDWSRLPATRHMNGETGLSYHEVGNSAGAQEGGWKTGDALLESRDVREVDEDLSVNGGDSSVSNGRPVRYTRKKVDGEELVSQDLQRRFLENKCDDTKLREELEARSEEQLSESVVDEKFASFSEDSGRTTERPSENNVDHSDSSSLSTHFQTERMEVFSESKVNAAESTAAESHRKSILDGENTNGEYGGTAKTFGRQNRRTGLQLARNSSGVRSEGGQPTALEIRRPSFTLSTEVSYHKSGLSEAGESIAPCEMSNSSGECSAMELPCTDTKEAAGTTGRVTNAAFKGTIASPEPSSSVKLDSDLTPKGPAAYCAHPANHDVIINPLRRPPSADELMATLKDYGLPECKYQKAFCSNPDDIPQCRREVGGRSLSIQSRQVKDLEDFDTCSSFQALRHWRLITCATDDDIFTAHCQQNPSDVLSNIERDAELRLALMGDKPTVITPCRGPPSGSSVRGWCLEKLASRRAKLLQARAGTTKVEKVSEDELNVDGKSRGVSPKRANSAPEEQTSEEFLLEGSGLEAKSHGGDPAASSDSAAPAEVTSPCSLFSPVQRTFACASKQKDAERDEPPSRQRSLRETAHASPEHRDETSNPDSTAPYKVSNQADVTHPGLPGSQSPNDKVRSPGGSPQESVPVAQQSITSPVASPPGSLPFPSLVAPHHSTPVCPKQSFGGFQSPRCTPIAMKVPLPACSGDRHRVDLDTRVPRPLASCEPPSAFRHQLLSTQLKFVTPNALPRPPLSSQIEGPSPNNTHGFKVSQLNLQDSKSLHEKQHLTLLSVEVHVRSRRDLRPDPEFDPVCAVFYHLQADSAGSPDKVTVTGILCVHGESAVLSATFAGSDRNENENSSTCVGPAAPETSSMSSTAKEKTRAEQTKRNSVAGSVSQISNEEGARRPRRRTLLSRSGVTGEDIHYVKEERELFDALIKVVRKWDPDILLGFEVQMLSWGYLIQRALTFDLDLCAQLSRVSGSANQCNFDAKKDAWGAAHSSEIKVAGRILLNVWRLLRHEVTLNVYSFENVAFHVLHERVPLFSFRTLSDWWDHKTACHRWRTVEHYVTRCRGNVRLLEQLDFIGRTSELARLFGILFYSVISRGTQYRVESMMLRIAKPMSYIAVSPSTKQRASMAAPETIPLVMEPESRFYTDPVLVLDFQSLYPSMVIAYNYCFSTCLGRVANLAEYGDFKFGATTLNVPPSVLKKLASDIHISPNGVAFAKSHIRRGILPRMLEEILQTRIMVKNSMKRWKNDKSLGRMLDARQLGLKLIANVTFGYTSAHFSGRMPCVEVGDTIVRKARETLERAIELVNSTAKWGARVVYGDTDSMFVLLEGATKERAFQVGREIVDAVTAVNPKPVKLKFEKVYLPCVLQTKKRYVGYMYETLDQAEPVYDAKGIETVRRDGCPAVAKILEKSLKILFESRDLSLAKKFVQRQCTKLMEGRVSLQDFTFAKEYRGMGSYKPGACVPALALTRRMLKEDRRSEPRVGERVPYVVVYGSPGLPLIQLVRRPHEVLTDPSLRLNASYYITKQILPPLDRAFSLIGVDVRSWYSELPRIVRVAHQQSQPSNLRKGTISQYFSVMNCPVCQELTPADLCTRCQANPQRSAVLLTDRVRVWERTHAHLSEICHQCCGSRDTKLCCVSLDCPVLYKLAQTTRDLSASRHIRDILQNL